MKRVSCMDAPWFFYNYMYTSALKQLGYTGLHMSVRPFVRPLKHFVKGFSTTMQVRVVIFGILIDDNMLYLGIANQPSATYSSLNMSGFLSFHTSNNDFFVKKISVKPCKLK